MTKKADTKKLLKCSARPEVEVVSKQGKAHGFACKRHVPKVYGEVSRYGNTITKYPRTKPKKAECGVVLKK